MIRLLNVAQIDGRMIPAGRKLSLEPRVERDFIFHGTAEACEPDEVMPITLSEGWVEPGNADCAENAECTELTTDVGDVANPESPDVAEGTIDPIVEAEAALPEDPEERLAVEVAAVADVEIGEVQQ